MHIFAWLWWRFLRAPRYRPGAVVRNIREPAWGTPHTLARYIGPHLGFRDGGRRFFSELWETADGTLCAAGYFWR